MGVCNPRERKSLLTFKQDIDDSSNNLSSWVGEDCCRWNGVICNNNNTNESNIVHLNLHGFYLSGKLNPSLMELKQLNHLDLSFNSFSEITIPSFFSSFMSLRYLNLSYSSFRDINDLEWLSHLSSLQYLDMTNLDLSKVSNWLDIVNKLPSLLELRLHYCNIRSLPSISYLNFTSLSVLDLSYNGLNSTLPEWVYNLINLEELNLRYNIFQGTISEAISEAISNLTQLTTLDLYSNEFEGEIPIALGSLCNLQTLDLSDNSFRGEITGFLGHSSQCIGRSLKSINLDANKLSGPLPDQLGKLKNLESLSSKFNSFSGSIPSSLGRLSSLTVLDLAFNRLNGSLPESFGHLSSLKLLRLSYNAMGGAIYEVHFTSLTKLEDLEIDSLDLKLSPNWVPPFQLRVAKFRACRLGPRFPEWLRTQKHIVEIDLSNAGISGTIPTWFWNLSSQFTYLNISQNEMEGEVPDLLLKTDASIGIYMNSNKFMGKLPRISSSVNELDLSNNLFSGPISVLICNPSKKMNNLKVLGLSGNLLSGELPECWSNWSSLTLIRLGNNNLTGKIPSSMGSIHDLRSLHLRNNYMSGELPSSLRNCIELRVIDLSENGFTGSIATWINGESFRFLLVLILRRNKFYGDISQELCHLSSLQLLDFSYNNLSGSIPRCFSNFTAMATKEKIGDRISYSMYFNEFGESASFVTKGREFEYSSTLSLFTIINLSNNNLSGGLPEELTSLHGLRSLNLSDNHFTGKIPDKIGEMSLLESLDLSSNKLSGLIPQSMVNLSFLSHLNLSYNNLSGKIPSSTQLRSLNESSYMGNQQGLCGPPLKNCITRNKKPQESDKNDTAKEEEENEEEDDWIEMKWFYVSLVVGFVIGLWGFCIVLIGNQSWRFAYFGLLDNMFVKLSKCCSLC